MNRGKKIVHDRYEEDENYKYGIRNINISDFRIFEK